MENYKMLINGKLVDAISGKTFTAVNPATEEKIGEAPLGDKSDVDDAVAAALKAFPSWSQKTHEERAKVILRIAAAIQEHTEELAYLEYLDHGWLKNFTKPYIIGCAEKMRVNVNLSKSLMSDVIPTKDSVVSFMRREPIGVCALITPWNFPFNVVVSKMSCALATGNTCVIKPPTVDALSALKLAEILVGLDIPPGVVNIITGPGRTMGEALASHRDVDAISFTGSSEIGKKIMELASRTIKRLSFDLGGKNPFIVFDDADLKKAAESAVYGTIFNSGMVCTAPGRYYVHAKVYDEFVERVVEGLKKVVVGDPANLETKMGPVVSAEHRDKVESLIESGIKEGAKLVLGGKRPTTPPLDKGYFVMPTVFTHIKQDSTLAKEEVFGPVACIMEPFSTEEEVMELANDNRYGLSSSVWTKDLARGFRMVYGLRSGSARVNGYVPPLGLPAGGYRESGLGKENGIMGLEEYTNLKAVMVELA